MVNTSGSGRGNGLVVSCIRKQDTVLIVNVIMLSHCHSAQVIKLFALSPFKVLYMLSSQCQSITLQLLDMNIFLAFQMTSLSSSSSIWGHSLLLFYSFMELPRFVFYLIPDNKSWKKVQQ